MMTDESGRYEFTVRDSDGIDRTLQIDITIRSGQTALDAVKLFLRVQEGWRDMEIVRGPVKVGDR